MASRKGKLGWRWMILIAVPYIAPLVVLLRLLRHWLVHRTHRKAAALVALAGLVVSPIVAASLLLLHPAPLPLAAPPSENCLPTLCNIGASLPENLLLPYPNTAGKLEAAVTQSKESLRNARAAMTKPGWVGVNYHLQDTDDFKERAPHRDPLILLKNAFLAAGDLAVAEGRLGDGLDSYMDVLRLAQCSGVGGLPFDTSLAVEFETDGMSRVHANVKKMTTEQCEAWIAALSSQEHAFEPADLLRKRRYAWVDRIASWNDRLVLRYLRMIGVSLSELKLDVYERLRPTRIRLLMAELALRRYLLDHGRYPDRLDELVPQYVSSVPLDPFGRDEMVYRLKEGVYCLYSVGRDEVDDGGALPPHPYWFRQGDFTVDILDGP